MVKKYATLWGKESDGELLVPIINLWKTKEGGYIADNLGGALPHNTKVEILEKDNDPDGWVKVYKLVEHEGKTYPQKGWVKKSLIRF